MKTIIALAALVLSTQVHAEVLATTPACEVLESGQYSTETQRVQFDAKCKVEREQMRIALLPSPKIGMTLAQVQVTNAGIPIFAGRSEDGTQIELLFKRVKIILTDEKVTSITPRN